MSSHISLRKRVQIVHAEVCVKVFLWRMRRRRRWAGKRGRLTYKRRLLTHSFETFLNLANLQNRSLELCNGRCPLGVVLSTHRATAMIVSVWIQSLVASDGKLIKSYSAWTLALSVQLRWAFARALEGGTDNCRFHVFFMFIRHNGNNQNFYAYE